jgi:hypothetical protein
MRALVVYESMFGSTRLIAEAIAQGLGSEMDAPVVRATEAAGGDLAAFDLSVVGAPTHAHGMPRSMTRKGAPDYIEKPGNELVLEQEADSDPGVREWLTSLGDLHVQGAAFDTRFKASPVLTGRASRGISKSLRGHGIAIAVPPESFLVDKHSQLLAGEVDRARAWGDRLTKAVVNEVKVKPR